MKRTILAVGLMSATLPASAAGPDVNLAGTFAISLSWYEQHNDPDIDTTDVDLENNGSNFRITAATQDVGIRAFAVYERGASNDRRGSEAEAVREFFGGVSGQYGTLVTGIKATDYRLAGQRLDPFYNTSAATGADGRFASEGASYGLSRLTTGYTPNTVAYTSPVLYGATVNVATFVADNDSDDGVGDEADYAAGVGYANSDLWGLDAGVQVVDFNGSNNIQPGPVGEASALRAHVGFGQGLWSVGASYEIIDSEFLDDSSEYAFVAATYQVYEALRVAVTAGTVDAADDDFVSDGAGGSLGMFWDVTKNLNAYWALRYVALDTDDDETNATLAAGAKFTFDVDL